jgi:hypothetical protein
VTAFGTWSPEQVEEYEKRRAEDEATERMWRRAEASWDAVKPSAYFCSKYGQADAEVWAEKRTWHEEIEQAMERLSDAEDERYWQERWESNMDVLCSPT